jgi:hypothetical protein
MLIFDFQDGGDAFLRIIGSYTEISNFLNPLETMRNGVFWDVTPCGSCKNRRFGGLSASFIRVTRIGELGTTLAVNSNRRTLVFLRSFRRVLVTASIVPSSPILVTVIKKALSSP